MNEVSFFIDRHEGKQREILQYFHQLLTVELELIDKIRYKIPFYYHKSWICYMNPNKNGTVELAFPRGGELSNEQGLLQDKGRKQVKSIEFADPSEIPESLIRAIIHEAIILDETVPYKKPG